VLVDVNEQNEQALGFYLRMGFEVEGRSELDSTGKPFPLLHMRLIDLAGEPSSDRQAVIGGSIESTPASSSANR
jgi:hypothetical protein